MIPSADRPPPGADAHVLVVGGGPSGSTVAGLIARLGWRVLVLDRARFPRPKPCGECINPGGVTLLRRLGLLDRILSLDPAPIRGWRVRTPTSATATATFGEDCPAGMALSRESLDHALLRAAESRGARVLEGRKVVELRLDGENGRLPAVRVREPDGGVRLYRAPVVVGADGLRSVTARSLDAYRRRPRIRKLSLTARVRGRGPRRDRGLLVLGRRRMLGLAPVHARRDLWNATVVVDADIHGEAVAADPREFLEEAVVGSVRSWMDAPELLEGPWASGPFDWPTERVSARGALLVGDASGYYDPLTGQGIYRALRSAELASTTVDRGLRSVVSGGGTGCGIPGFPGYDRELRREFRSERWIQQLVELVVSRDVLRETAIRRLARAPVAMRALIRVTGNRSRPQTLLRPWGWG